MIRTPPSNPQNRAPANPSREDSSHSPVVDGAAAAAPGAVIPAEEGNLNGSAHPSINQQQTLNASTHNISAFSSMSRRSGETVLDRLRASAEKARQNNQNANAEDDGVRDKPRRQQPTRAAASGGTGALPRQDTNALPGDKKKKDKGKQGKPPISDHEAALRIKMQREEDYLAEATRKARSVLRGGNPSQGAIVMCREIRSITMVLANLYTEIQQEMRNRGIGGQPIYRYDELIAGLEENNRLADDLEKALPRSDSIHTLEPPPQRRIPDMGLIQDARIPPRQSIQQLEQSSRGAAVPSMVDARTRGQFGEPVRGADVPLMVDARTRQQGLQLSELHQHPPRQVRLREPRVAPRGQPRIDFNARYNDALPKPPKPEKRITE